MPDPIELKTPASLKAFSAPATTEVYEALAEEAPPGSAGVPAAQVAARLGISPETVHYHIRKLERLGIAEAVGQTQTGARPQKLFALAADGVEFRKAGRGPASLRAIVRAARLLLRRAEREYESALGRDASGPWRPRALRKTGWLTTEELAQIELLEDEVARIIDSARQRERRDGRNGRRPVTLTVVLSPREG